MKLKNENLGEVENRYDGNLRTGNIHFAQLSPSHDLLRNEQAVELSTMLDSNSKVLELGVGSGLTTKYLLDQNPKLLIDVLDVSPEMIESAQEYLKTYGSRVSYIVDDALRYLQNTDKKYDVIVSTRTIHNFPWDKKEELIKAIYNNLTDNGVTLLLDKVFPDEGGAVDKLTKLQNNRYSRYLTAEQAKDIIDHEHQDIEDTYRMDEGATFDLFENNGFQDVEIIDRVERDVLLSARKKSD